MNKPLLIGGLVVTLGMVALFGASFGKNPNKIDSPLVGRAAPAFALQRLASKEELSLAGLRGKPVVVNFWATWCQPCQAEHGVLQQAAQMLGQHVQFVGIVYDDEDRRIQEFLDRHGSGYPTLVDKGGKAAIAYGVYGVPETFFIDRNGKVVAKHEGPLDPTTLVAYVQRLLEAT